ncbi:MAG: gfo/Idh/MocA family oxidoreductase, partial [Candidatus Nanopelagicales bacterium]
FVAMTQRFLTAVREGVVLDGGDALETHELCERVLAECLV